MCTNVYTEILMYQQSLPVASLDQTLIFFAQHLTQKISRAAIKFGQRPFAYMLIPGPGYRLL